MKVVSASLCIALAAMMTISASAAQVGDKAAPLQIAKWVKGEAVKVGEPGEKVYVVEFWATWCGPCRTSIPHLTELQKKYKDKGVVFIGVSSEMDEETVANFVKEQGDKMDYTVALDDSNKTNDAYMKAFGVNGIPHAFIVAKNGQIVWHDHPMAGLDEALEKITSDDFDMAKMVEEAAEADRKAAEAAKREMRTAGLRGLFQAYVIFSGIPEDADAAKQLGQILLQKSKSDPEFVNWAATFIFSGQYDELNDLDKGFIVELTKNAYDADPTDERYIGIYATALVNVGKQDAAVKVLKKAITDATADEVRERLSTKLKALIEDKAGLSEKKEETPAEEATGE